MKGHVMRIKKIVMEVLCLEPDAQDVVASLTDAWFPENEFPLINLSIKIREPSANESDGGWERLCKVEHEKKLCKIDSTT
jgi:hypothetical protein